MSKPLTITSLKFFLDVAETCDEFGLSISSGKRDEEYNSLVAGHPKSRHLDWDAWDLVTVGNNIRAAFSHLKAKGYYGYVKTAGMRNGVKVWQIHIQRLPPRKGIQQ